MKIPQHNSINYFVCVNKYFSLYIQIYYINLYNLKLFFITVFVLFQLSWVDITFVGNLIAAQDFTGITLGDKYPKIKQLIAEVQGLRGIKEYIEKTYK